MDILEEMLVSDIEKLRRIAPLVGPVAADVLCMKLASKWNFILGEDRLCEMVDAWIAQQRGDHIANNQ
jgi:hypothetical protein